jgi:hypothetical protein
MELGWFQKESALFSQLADWSWAAEHHRIGLRFDMSLVPSRVVDQLHSGR